MLKFRHCATSHMVTSGPVQQDRVPTRLERIPWGWWVLLGTVLRGVHGVAAHTWNTSPDQLAWGLGLEDAWRSGGAAYLQWVHYPHEGGSLLLSLLARVFVPLASVMPPLSWAALVADSGCRAVQILVARRSFSPQAALAFSLWTVLAVPLMLPWGTINMGLHALVSFAPFLLLAAVQRPVERPLLLGVGVGALCMLAYDAALLVPAYVGFVWLGASGVQARAGHVLKFLLGAVLGLLPHVLTRLWVDHGFLLEQLPMFSIRGLEQDPLHLADAPGRLLASWTTWLPGSLFMTAVDAPLVRVLVLITASLLVWGGLGLRGVPTAQRRVVYMGLWLIAVFWAVVVFAPFFEPRDDGAGYVYYRYFPFIVPLVALLVLEGLVQRRGTWAAWGFVGFCGLSSLVFLVRQEDRPLPMDEATGWVLGRKYGHDPQLLGRIMAGAGTERKYQLTFGAGWGTAAAMFDRRTATDTAAMHRFQRTRAMWPVGELTAFDHGVERAFGPDVTPRLDPAIRELLDLEGIP